MGHVAWGARAGEGPARMGDGSVARLPHQTASFLTVGTCLLWPHRQDPRLFPSKT